MQARCPQKAHSAAGFGQRWRDTVSHTVSSSLGTQEGYHSMTAGGLDEVRGLGSGGWK